MKDYLKHNLDSWNQRLDAHLKSDFYDLAAFKSGKNALNDIELDLLGDLSGKSVLHLQCHFGQDSLSMSRMGASVTGVDLSDKAIATAKALAKELKLDATFICSDVYALPEHLDGQFDRVFVSYGAIPWLPDLNKWAGVVNHFLKPGGQLIFAEFHPVVWMYDDDFTFVQYAYSNKAPIVEDEQGTYADKSAEIQVTNVTWNHGLAEVIQSLLDQGLVLKDFQEYDYSPYAFVNGCVEYEPGRYRIKAFEDKIPLVYSLVVEKP